MLICILFLFNLVEISAIFQGFKVKNDPVYISSRGWCEKLCSSSRRLVPGWRGSVNHPETSPATCATERVSKRVFLESSSVQERADSDTPANPSPAPPICCWEPEQPHDGGRWQLFSILNIIFAAKLSLDSSLKFQLIKQKQSSEFIDHRFHQVTSKLSSLICVAPTGPAGVVAVTHFLDTRITPPNLVRPARLVRPADLTVVERRGHTLSH